MRWVRGIHDPGELAMYGLPPGTYAWLIELDDDELSQVTDVDLGSYLVRVLAIDNGQVDERVTLASSPKYVTLRGLAPLDVRRVEVWLAGTPAVLVRTWTTNGGSALNAFSLEGLDSQQLDLLVLRGRRLSDLDWRRLGRPRGSTVWTEAEFSEQLERLLRELRRNYQIPTRRLVADSLGMGVSTLITYLRRAGTTWAKVKRGDWPPE